MEFVEEEAGEFTFFTHYEDHHLVDHKGRRVGSKVFLIRGFCRWYLSVQVTRDGLLWGPDPGMDEYEYRAEAEADAQKVLERHLRYYRRRPHRFKPVPDTPDEEM